MVASNMFVDAVSLAARAFQHDRRDPTGELYLTHALDVAQALGPDATVAELSTAASMTLSKTQAGPRTISQTLALKQRSSRPSARSLAGQTRRTRTSLFGSAQPPETSE